MIIDDAFCIVEDNNELKFVIFIAINKYSIYINYFIIKLII